jgi:riboflavin kinase
MPKTVHIQGKIFSGTGEGAKFIQLPWVKRQITKKLGFTPYQGTLNIKLTEDSLNLKELLKKVDAIEILPSKGFSRGKCFEAYFMDELKCAIVMPDVVNYPVDVVEVIAPINLREKFNLKDGDMVDVKIIL